MKKTKLILLLPFLFLSGVIVAQETKKEPIVKWAVTTQFWARYSELNPGTTINGDKANGHYDVSIRRLRIPVSSQITPKLYAYAMFGGNNFNHTLANFPLQVLDLYAEYGFSKKFEVGIGKSGWQGLNRWNVRSSKSLMGLDTPLFTLSTVNKDDDLGRNLSVWFKGQVSQFDYRFVVSNPREVTVAPSGKVDFANNRPRNRFSTYVKYQFFEHESNKTAYQTGTYINKKKVFNIGGGAQYQYKAFADGDVNANGTTFYSMKNWAFDSFLSLPMANEQGVTAYLGYYNMDMGKNYIRNLGVNNPGFDGGTSFNGAGIAFPMMGTGSIVFSQLGYTFKVNNSILAQPNIAIQHCNYEGLNDPMTLYDLTLNLFFNNAGHDNKLSLGYQYRPIFDKATLTEVDRKGMAVLQYQVTID